MQVPTLKRLVVVIPTRNEEKSIGTILSLIPRNLAHDMEIVVVDKSYDSTSARAKEAGAYVVSQLDGGLGTAFQLGLEAGLKLDADALVHIDGDMQYDPKQMPLLLEPILNDKADMVLGQRVIQYRMPLIKHVGNELFSLIVSKLSGFKVADAQTGYRAFNKRALKALLSLRGDLTYTQESIFIAVKRGLRICEVPISFKKRNHGRSFINLAKYPIKVTLILALAYFRELTPKSHQREET